MSNSQLVTANVNVDNIANNLFQASLGVARCLFNDRVHPFAARAAILLGTKVPVCPETRRRVGDLATRTKRWQVLRDISMEIGFSKQDVASFLAENEAGIGFLSIVTPLLSARNSVAYGTTIIHNLLQKGKMVSLDLLPPRRNIQWLLEALTAKVSCSDFDNLLLGWKKLLDIERPKMHDVHKWRKLDRPWLTPPAECVEELLLAMLETEALEADAVGRLTSICVSVPVDFAAWTISLVEWFHGKQPDIVYVDTEESETVPWIDTINPSGQSKYLVRILKSSFARWEVRKHQTLNDFVEVVGDTSITADLHLPAVLVDPKTYIHWQLRVLSDRMGKWWDPVTLSKMLLMMIYELTERFAFDFRKGDSASATKPFKCDEVAKVALTLLDDELSGIDVAELSDSCYGSLQRTSYGEALWEITDLFLLILLLSNITNLREATYSSIKIWPYVKCSQPRARASVEEHLSGQEVADVIWLDAPSYMLQVLDIIGAPRPSKNRGVEDDGGLLANAYKGQVCYPLFLEGAYVKNDNPLLSRVVEGQLTLEGDKYDCIISDEAAISPSTWLDTRLTLDENETSDISTPFVMNAKPVKWLWTADGETGKVALQLSGGSLARVGPGQMLKVCNTTYLFGKCRGDCPGNNLGDRLGARSEDIPGGDLGHTPRGGLENLPLEVRQQVVFCQSWRAIWNRHLDKRIRILQYSVQSELEHLAAQSLVGLQFQRGASSLVQIIAERQCLRCASLLAWDFLVQNDKRQKFADFPASYRVLIFVPIRQTHEQLMYYN